MFKRNFENVDDFLNDASFVNWAKNQNQNDIDFWTDWIEKNPTKAQLVMDCKNIINGIAFKTFDQTAATDAAWKKFQRKQEGHSTKKPARTKKLWPYIATAASIALLIAINLVWNDSDFKSYETGYGELLRVTMPDGSFVNINANSKFSYYRSNPRNVFLEGEAYFDVEKKVDSKAKFFVHTKDLKISVHGTQFNVNTKRGKTDVTLDEGIIALTLKNGLSKTMRPGDHISYSESHDKIVKYKKLEAPEKISSWKDGTLVFENTPLYDAFLTLEDAYGLKAKFLDTESPNQKLSGGVPYTNLELSIKAIAKATNTSITIEDDKLLIQMNP